MKYPKDGSIVIVTWVDSVSAAEWTPRKKALKKNRPALCESIGRIHRTRDSVTVVPHSTTLGKSTDICGDMVIPIGCVVKIRVLEINKV